MVAVIALLQKCGAERCPKRDQILKLGAILLQIQLNRQFKSIATLVTADIPEFAVLIGRNGAGKTQLLGALKGGSAVIPDIGAGAIQMYDIDSFRPANTKSANRQSSQFALDTANAYLMSRYDGQSLIETAAEIFDESASSIEHSAGVQARDNFEHNLRDDIGHIRDFEIFAENDRESPYKIKFHDRVLEPLSKNRGGRQTKQSSNSFNGNPAALLSAAMKLNGKLPHELNRDDIIRVSHFEGDTISNSVSAVFTAYKADQFVWAHRRVETENVPFVELIAQYRRESPPPWEALGEVLSAMRQAAGDDGLFNFDFSDPRDYDLALDNYEQFSFKAEMTNRTTGARYELDSLSSGERILMGLCLASFNHKYLGRRPPKLLLLDELDALLHPSMVAVLVETLKTLFVSQGTKVLMTSHSPMTVATLDEADIFRVTRTGGNVLVSPTTKAEAINELSEGLATVDEGLRIAAYDESKVAILTEGNNTKHLKRWVDLNFSKDVYVIENLEQHSSDSELLTYGRLLGRMNTNTHFVVVWDCDSAGKAETLRQELPNTANVKPFAFVRRQENTITQSGIENNYDDEILAPYSISRRDNDDKLLSREFPKNRKTEFANHVLDQATPEYFTHYQALYDVVSGILGLPSEPSPLE